MPQPSLARTSALAGLLAASAPRSRARARAADRVPTSRRPPACGGADRRPPGRRARDRRALGRRGRAAGRRRLGSFGPGRLAAMGPTPGPVALAVGLEVLLGAGILLLSPWNRRRLRAAGEPPVCRRRRGDRASAERKREQQSAGDPAVRRRSQRRSRGRARATEALSTGPHPPTPSSRRRPRRGEVKPRDPFTFPTLPRMPAADAASARTRTRVPAPARARPLVQAPAPARIGRPTDRGPARDGEDAPVD